MPEPRTPTTTTTRANIPGAQSHGSLNADIIVANAPDPVFVSDLEGTILQANDAVSELLGFRPDEVVEQLLSRFISPEETREFLAALREVIESGVTRNARLNPRHATGEAIPTTLNASALRDVDGKVIGAIGILRDMRAYEQVVRDLQESKAELQERTRELIEANRVKDTFLSIASHELRTPLTSLKGLAQIARRRLMQAGASEVAYLEKMERAIGRMETLVNDLVDVSRIDAGKLAIRFAPDDLAALCRQVVDEQRAASEREILFTPPADMPPAVFDGDRISQVLTNLVSNALKFSPPAAPVIVTLERVGDEAVVSVRDRGRGISPEQLPHIFERFYQAPGSLTQVGPQIGLGLGLYVSHEIVTRHGGRIWAESTPGAGSVFSFALPLAPVAPRLQPIHAPAGSAYA